MHKRLTTVLLLLVVGLAACNRGQSPVAPKSELSSSDYEVISAYIAAKFAGKDGKEPVANGISKIVISDTSRSGDHDLLKDENGQPVAWEKTTESLRRTAPSLQQSTMDAFRKVNTRQAFLRRSFHPSIDYELVSAAQLDSIFSKNGGGWLAYYKQFPNSQGIATFSRVGFSADGVQAFFYLRNICGGLCGEGRYVVMENRSGRWVIAKEIAIWIS